jgi:hypothetical protein
MAKTVEEAEGHGDEDRGADHVADAGGDAVPAESGRPAGATPVGEVEADVAHVWGAVLEAGRDEGRQEHRDVPADDGASHEGEEGG